MLPPSRMLTTRNCKRPRDVIAFMRRATAGFCLMAVAFFCGCRPPGPKSLLDGERLIREGKYPEAVAELQKATQFLPGNAQAWNHLGLAYQYSGKPEEA